MRVLLARRFLSQGTYDPLNTYVSSIKPVQARSPAATRRRPEIATGDRHMKVKHQVNLTCPKGSEFHPTNIGLLSLFLSPTGQILPRKMTGLSILQQHRLARAIKASRHIGLLPYLRKPNITYFNGKASGEVLDRVNVPYSRHKEIQAVGLPKVTIEYETKE